jgi:hypothetical protein
MTSTLSTTIDSSKSALVLISVIVIVTIVDSQFVNAFYGTNLGSPGNLHFLLFVSFAILVSVVNTMLLRFAKTNDATATTSRPLLFKLAHIGTFIVQYAICLVLLIIILEMIFFKQYDKIFSLLVVYLSRIWPTVILGVLSFTFIQWFRFARSFSILIYGVVFSVILSLFLFTIPLLTEQFTNQPQSIYPRDYATVIEGVLVPSRSIAFVYGLVNYVLPFMIVSSWILTVSILKPYIYRIGKIKFWGVVIIPLVYQLFTFIVRDANLVSDPSLLDIIYSRQFQFLMGISYQIAGIFFATAFLTVARRMRRKLLKNYLIISSIGIMALFSSMQPGMPFYAAYPPFGLPTLLFLGLSSYMLLVGMLGIAANVSRDTKLRQEIYKGLEIDSEMLKNIGLAETQREIERRVLPLADKIKMSEEMRERTDPSEEDVKTMIEEVLNEIHSKRSHAKPADRLS